MSLIDLWNIWARFHSFIKSFTISISTVFLLVITYAWLMWQDNSFRSTTSMTKNQPSILSNGEVLNPKQGHHTPVTLAMNDFLALRFVLPFLFAILNDYPYSPNLIKVLIITKLDANTTLPSWVISVGVACGASITMGAKQLVKFTKC